MQAERAAYARYKRQLLATTAGLGAALSCATFAFYSRVGALPACRRASPAPGLRALCQRREQPPVRLGR